MSDGPQPRGPDSVRRSLSWTLFGELSFALSQWLSYMIIAKLGTPEALGRYSLGFAVATPIVIAASLHLRPIYVVDVRSRWGFADFLGLRSVLLPLALTLVAAVCLLRGWPWQTAVVVMLVGVVRVSESASDIYYARAQRAETMDPIGISRALRGVWSIGLLALGLALTDDDVIALALVAAAMLLHTLLFDRRKAAAIEVPGDPTGGSLRPRFRAESLRSLLREALPVGVAATLLALTANIPAYVLEQRHGLAAVGILAAVMSIRQVSSVINMALGSAAIARLAKLSIDNARGFWRLLGKLLAVVLTLNGLGLIVIVLFGDLYLRYGYTPEYEPYVPQLVLASIAAVVLGLSNILSQTLTALSQFRMQLWINLVVVGVAAALSMWWIPARGLDGAVETALSVACLRFVIYVAANLILGPRTKA
ncbi:MAG TPA: lipopolysaccharide biosynthesis protein [Enhygromyxa sp.]|nr:lipopolysaccharide biosynthesis protein [Enhygromyxa sp.]